MRLFFLINQHPLDGSAHALYCVRNAWWLAKTNPAAKVQFVYPGAPEPKLFQSFNLTPLENLSVVALRAVQRKKGGRGVTINAIYHWNLHFYLSRLLQSGDLVVTASFPKIFEFLLARRRLRANGFFVYEVHQLGKLDANDKAAKLEESILTRVDGIAATTNYLANVLTSAYAVKGSVSVNGLACGFTAEDFAPARAWFPDSTEAFTVGYIGSLYEEQGIDWLAGSWPEIANPTRRVRLKIAGGGSAHLDRLRINAREDVNFAGKIPVSQISKFLEDIDALVIPSLNRGRMPYVAITKAFDYLAMRRPILAANLPSIREVLTPEKEALLFEPGDLNSFCQQLDRLRNSAELRNSIVLAALGRAKVLGWEARSIEYWRFLEKIRNAG
jgi:glycosyltransferase involved in cell wall biosynthesis